MCSVLFIPSLFVSTVTILNQTNVGLTHIDFFPDYSPIISEFINWPNGIRNGQKNFYGKCCIS